MANRAEWFGGILDFETDDIFEHWNPEEFVNSQRSDPSIIYIKEKKTPNADDILLDQAFNDATKFIKANIPRSLMIPNDTKSKLYGYYKQALFGPCNRQKPPSHQVLAKAKYDAWTAAKGIPSRDAKIKYIKQLQKTAPDFKPKLPKKF